MKKKLIIGLIAAVVVVGIAVAIGVNINKDETVTTAPTVTADSETESKEEVVPVEKKEEVQAPKVEEVKAEPAKVDLNETVYAISEVNVRPTAGTDGDSVGHLYSGDSVVRQEIVGEWSRIDFKGGTAYVKSEYLSTTAPVVAPVTTPKKSGGETTPKKSGGGTTSSGNTGSGNKKTTVSEVTGSGKTGGGETTTTKPPSKGVVLSNHWGDFLSTDPVYGTLYTDKGFQSGYTISVSQYNAFKAAGRIASAPYTYTYPDGRTEECVGEYLIN